MCGFQSVQIFPGFDEKGFVCLAVAVGFSCSDMKTGSQPEGKGQTLQICQCLDTSLTHLHNSMSFKSRVSTMAEWEG